jgi:hypothetical protein
MSYGGADCGESKDNGVPFSDPVIKDILGREIKPGDRLAYAQRFSTTPYMDVGEVIEVVWARPKSYRSRGEWVPAVRVKVLKSARSWRVTETATWTMDSRMAIIRAEGVEA